MRRVYFDNNATTPVLPEVFEAMRPYFGEHFGNASSIHHHGQETPAAVERARESVAALLAAGKLPIDVQKVECDLLSIAWRKVQAPQGVGALYVRKGPQLHPMVYGGSHEPSRPAGTENVPGIVGVGKAAEMARDALD